MKQTSPPLVNPTVAAGRRYLLRFGIAMAAAMLLIVLGATWGAGLHGLASYLVAVAPIVPLGVILYAAIAYVRDTDELQRLRTLEAIGIAFAISTLVVVGYALLEDAGAPRISAWWAWVLLMGSWGVAGIVRGRCDG